MTEIKIKQAKLENAALVANLSWQTFFDTYVSFNTKADMEMFLKENFSKKTIEEELKDEKNIFLLASLKKEIVGYTKLSTKKNEGIPTDNCFEISRFYAVKNKIGQGIGKALMQSIIELAKKNKVEVLWLCVWSQNHHAIQFYRKFGFEKFGDFTFMLGNDAQDDWLMKLEVGESLKVNNQL